MSENFFKPKEDAKIRILPNVDFSSLYPSSMRVVFSKGNSLLSRRSRLQKILLNVKLYELGLIK